MPLAKQLGAAMCERILGELVQLTGKTSGLRLGIVCPWHSESTPGACWYDPEEDRAVCYGCQQHGDLVDIFCAVNGYEMGSRDGIKAFFAKYAPNAKLERASRQQREVGQSGFVARETMPPAASWVEGATAWVEKSTQRLGRAQLVKLAAWGITPETAAACHIGYAPEDRFVKFTHWGLPYAENNKGHERCIHLPAGLVFPSFYADGSLQRVKVRLDQPRDGEPKYKIIVGSDTGYAIFGKPEWRVWLVVETERDAMLLWQDLAAYEIGAMATGNASLPPDARAHAILDRSVCIVNALDNDAAGRRTSWAFTPGRRFSWNLTYPQCVRWLTPREIGKDAGNLAEWYHAGGPVCVREWALASLPGHARSYCEARLVAGEAAKAAADKGEEF